MLLHHRIKKINDLNEFILNKQLNKKYLEYKDTREIDLFKLDFEQIKNVDDEIQQFLRDVKYSKEHPIQSGGNGWINTFLRNKFM